MPTSLGTYRADLPPAVNVVLQKAMAKNPHDRYPTVLAFALDLQKASQEFTQLLFKPAVFVQSPVTPFRTASTDIQANEKALVEVQPFDLFF